ncbi:hypothetical protein AHAS_Ahas18G0204400 [Arachis hypogaea]
MVLPHHTKAKVGEIQQKIEDGVLLDYTCVEMNSIRLWQRRIQLHLSSEVTVTQPIIQENLSDREYAKSEETVENIIEQEEMPNSSSSTLLSEKQ